MFAGNYIFQLSFQSYGDGRINRDFPLTACENLSKGGV